MSATPESARRGDRDVFVVVMRNAVNEVCPLAERPGYCINGTAILVETLLERGGDGDWPKPKRASTDRRPYQAEGGWAIRDIWLLRLCALMGRARATTWPTRIW